ncbi:MAG: SGNH/GDSL hydrolase family protein [Clostridia bacterium]|nr:SGNH/GDSL hydrolase family protein [Clostridia bacterium]
MKKTQAKRLAAILMCAVMLLSAVALPITVSAETELVNHYDASTSVLGIPNVDDMATPTPNQTYFVSAPIAVNGGDTLCFGPCDVSSGWHIALYNSDGTKHADGGTGIGKSSGLTKVATFADQSVIYSYTLPAGVSYIRLTGKKTYQYQTLLTINQPFDVASYTQWANPNQGGDENQGGEDQLVNKYNPALATVNKIPDIGNSTGFANGSNTNFFASSAIEVQGGDTIYVGPINTNSGWNVALYDNTPVPNNKQNGVKLTNKVAEFPNGAVIYSYTIPEGTVAIRLTANPAYMNTMLVTINQAFDVESYYAYADANGLVLSNELRPFNIETPTMAPVGSASSLVNLFPRTDAYDPLLRQNVNVDTYKTSAQIDVQEGDVITVGAMRLADSSESLLFYNANGLLFKTINMNALPMREDIGRGYAIYWLTVPEGVASIEVKAHIGVYNDGDILVTKNQPFTGAQLRTFLDIPDLSAEAMAHDFYGKKALFIGDSISYGSYDTPPSYRNPSASWARRLALETGLIPTNASVGGASLAKSTGRGWIYDQYNKLTDKNFDMIVINGGVNDSRSEIAIGSPLPVGSDEATLEANVGTYIGGLQWLFHNAKKNSPNADLYYVATFKVPQQKGNLPTVGQYYAQAELLCKLYGVKFVDMYNYSPLYEDYNPNDTTIVPDQLHPTKAGYDLIFPHMLDVFEAVQIPDPEFDLDMLNVSYQFSTDNHDIRLITTVDGLDYQEVGFIITMGNQRAKISMNTVYSSITGADKTYTPDLVGAPTSEYFALFNITDIPEEFTIFVQAYVVTEDGYTYYGSVRDITKSNGTLIPDPNGTQDGYVVSWNDLNWKAAA